MLSIFAITPHAETLVLDATVGIALPEHINEDRILAWINQRRILLQYNDCDSIVIDTRDNDDVQVSSPVSQEMEYLPQALVITFNLFDTFCDYFDIPSHLKCQLNTINPQQSVVIVNNPFATSLFVFPYFKNVNYAHVDVNINVTLRALMEMQDQALILNCEVYPYYHDANTAEDYFQSSSLFTSPTSVSSGKKRKCEESDEADNIMDIDNIEEMEFEEEEEEETHEQLKIQCTEETHFLNQPPFQIFERIFKQEKLFISSDE